MYNQKMRVSRYGLQLFRECPRCFWLDRKNIAKRPQPYPYTLSNTADLLTKREFDIYRQKGIVPEVLKSVANAKLFQDQGLLDRWRDNFNGLNYFDSELDVEVFGAIDDCLEFNTGELAVIDYKTSGALQIIIYPDYQFQMDVYTYILEKMGYKTKRKAYFIFYVVDKTREAFNNQLLFREELKEVDTNPDIVYPVLEQVVKALKTDKPPLESVACQYCQWRAKQKDF